MTAEATPQNGASPALDPALSTGESNGYAPPTRIQRKRSKGWRMPEGVVYVGRPSSWGNDWTVKDAASWGVPAEDRRAWCVRKYAEDVAEWVRHSLFWQEQIAKLRGRDLACWCSLDEPCHADVLLDLANTP